MENTMKMSTGFAEISIEEAELINGGWAWYDWVGLGIFGAPYLLYANARYCYKLGYSNGYNKY